MDSVKAKQRKRSTFHGKLNIFASIVSHTVVLKASQSQIRSKRFINEHFMNCLSLKSFELPENLEEISESSFSKDITMNKIKVPDSVGSIKRKAFSESYKLSKIRISSNTELIEFDDGSFEDTNISELTVNLKASVLFEARNANQLK